MLTPPAEKLKRIPKKTKTLLDRFTDFIALFLGSWLAIAFHTLWFTFWLVFNFDISLLTFAVSLEAIFIGIFLLMSANKAEIQRDRRETKQRASDRRRIELDIKLDQKADRQLTQIKHFQKEIHEEIQEIKKELKNLRSR